MNMNNNMMSFLEELDTLAFLGVEIEMAGNCRFRVGGFFKHGQVTVCLQNKIVYGRYDTETPFDSNGLTNTLLNLAKKLCREYYGKDANYLDYYSWKSVKENLNIEIQ